METEGSFLNFYDFLKSENIIITEDSDDNNRDNNSFKFDYSTNENVIECEDMFDFSSSDI